MFEREPPEVLGDNHGLGCDIDQSPVKKGNRNVNKFMFNIERENVNYCFSFNKNQ